MKYLISFVFLFSFSLSISQEDTSLSRQLDTVVLSTSFSSLESFKIESISRKEIDNNDGIILTPILNRVAGVNMQQGALNTSRVTIRGFGSRAQFSTNRLKLYVNEIPLTDANGESVLDDFDMNSIGAIRIVKGPKATEYGSNLGGTVLFSTRQDINTFDLQMGYGTFDRLFLTTDACVNLGATRVQLYYNQIDSDEYRQNSNYERQNLSLFSKTTLSNNWQLDNMFIGTRLKAFIPSSLNQTDFETNPQLAANNWFESAGFESYQKFLVATTLTHAINEYSNWKTSIFFNYRDGYEPRPFDILDEELLGLGLRSVYTTNFKLFGTEFLSQSGVEFQTDHYTAKNYDNLYRNSPVRESVQGDLENAFSQDRYRLNAFSKVELQPIDGLEVELGLNFNLSKYKTSDEFLDNGMDRSGSLTYSPKLIPNLNLGYKLSTSFIVSANFSQGIATPTSDESLDSEGFFNKDLKPSFGNQYEIGLQWQVFQNALTIETNAFLINVEDLIVARRVEEDRFIGINAGKSNYAGLEFSSSYTGKLSKDVNFNLYTSLAVYDFKFDDFVDDTSNFSGNRIPAVPEYNFNMGGDINWRRKLYFGFDWQFVDEMPLNDANTLYSSSYQVLNLRSKYMLRRSGFNATCTVGVNNVFDKNFAASVLPNAVGFGGNAPRYFYPSLPRNFYFRLLLSLE